MKGNDQFVPNEELMVGISLQGWANVGLHL